MLVVWGLFVIFSILFFWMYLGYPLTLWLINNTIKNPINKASFTPNVSVIVCTYNESSCIERRIQNLIESDYPNEKIEILIVDSASQDNTVEIVKNSIAQYPNYSIKLLQEDKRRGKVSAINMGLSVALGEIIILTDGPALFWKNTIKKVVQNFADPKVGGATGNFTQSEDDGETPAQQTEWVVFNYRKILRRLESATDSTTWLSGELTAFRKSIISKLPTDVIVDDAHIALRIRHQGYRVIVEESANYTEKRPTIYRETVTNKIKAIAPGIRETVRFKDMVFNPKYQIFGLLIFPARILHFYLNPFILIGFLVCMLILVIHYLGIISVIIGLGVLFLVATLAKYYKNGVLLRPFVAFFLMQYIILAGLVQYVRGDYSATWKQVTTTRT